MLKIDSFKKLGLLYIIALSCIACSIIGSQVYIQKFIGKQTHDSREINIAGRQRMLSQKISKLALEIKSNPTNLDFQSSLADAVNLWAISHKGLLLGNDSLGLDANNSSEILKLFSNVQPHHEAIVSHVNSLLTQLSKEKTTIEQITKHVDSILDHEESFLIGMDAIVFQYDNEAKSKVANLRKIEIILFGIALSIIILEFFFFFLPTSKKVASTFAAMTKSEEDSKRMTQEINKLYIELAKSYQDLEAVNIEPQEPSIFMKMDAGSNIGFVSKKFLKLIEYDEKDVPPNLIEWLGNEGYGKDFLQDIFDDVAHGKTWNGEIKLNSGYGDILWIEMFIVPVSGGKYSKDEIIVVGRDLTEIKEAKFRSREINREQIEKRVKEQEYRSVLILEGQEEERKRISQEIHDGIGQMLTALKLNLEGLTPSSSPHMKKRLADTRSLMKGVIKEVRRVSFNLTPSSLSDFGIVPAMKKISSEVSALTSTEVIFENKTKFINRLENNIETNLYRIVQEAVNNGIKYAKAKKIVISFEHNMTSLVVTVKDNGVGFDYEKLNKSGHFGASGHGIFNMKERTAFINGNFNIETAVDKGTKITITLPLN
ncbi:ATP-binding protein [Reichenbachiella sp. MALMAid0571]|uniref:sensor histidine kinase n=1 Tax=Reichenbachiella sp. MALMAid0571 TaxID=3143939 RepID=UPI0032DFB6DE